MKNKKVKVRVKQYTEETIPETWISEMLDMCGKEYYAEVTSCGYEICEYAFTPEDVEVIEEETSKPKRDSILQEAYRIVNGERANDYSSAKEAFNKIASITNLLLDDEEKDNFAKGSLKDTVACKVLIAVKLVGLCGYDELLDILEEI